MNLRKIMEKPLEPKQTHITTVKFKYIKHIKSYKHMSNYQWSRTATGIYGIKGKKIYRMVHVQTNYIWYYKFIAVDVEPYFETKKYDRSKKETDYIFYDQFQGEPNRYPEIRSYLNSLLESKKIDFFFTVRSFKGLIELIEAVHIKKYKTSRIEYELKTSATERRENNS